MSDAFKKIDSFSIWEGYFSDFASAKKYSKGLGFQGPDYLARGADALDQCLDCVNKGKAIPFFHKQRYVDLPLLLLMLQNQKESDISILDFGGGFGIGPLVLNEALPSRLSGIDYYIQDFPEVIEIAARKIKDVEVRFISDFTKLGKFEIVFVASCLQYIEDWRMFLNTISSCGARYVYFADIFAGDINSYVTLQNYYESTIPHWVLNLGEIIDVMKIAGYSLIMKTSATSIKLGLQDELPMENLPRECRIPRTLNLFFENKSL